MFFGTKTAEVDIMNRSYIENLNLSLYDNVIATGFFSSRSILSVLELVDLCMCCIYFPLFPVDYSFTYTNYMFIRKNFH
jgi:hypothetical protein